MSYREHITEILGAAPEHDLSMPHDVRYPGQIRGCPPNCPYRVGFEEAAALAAAILAVARENRTDIQPDSGEEAPSRPNPAE